MFCLIRYSGQSDSISVTVSAARCRTLCCCVWPHIRWHQNGAPRDAEEVLLSARTRLRNHSLCSNRRSRHLDLERCLAL